jgi:hypothetical protein
MKTHLHDIPIIILNLYDQPQKLVETKKELIYNGFTNIKHVVQGERVSKKNKLRATALMHKSAIITAALNCWPEVLIVEDDFLFSSQNSPEFMEEAWQNIPDDWHIFTGGTYYISKRALYFADKKYIKHGEFSGLHFYVANQSVYDHILACSYRRSLDWEVNWNNDINVYCAYPSCTKERNGYSDGSECEINRDLYVKKRGLEFLQ